jgi:3,4-dihydroxy 2-butanone 4-phosphate synthase/GTP cyclohydrolase II
MMVQASRDRVTTFDAYARMGLGRDYRRYETVAFAAAALAITAPLTLLTNNPDKVAALRRANVAIEDVVPLEHAASPFNLHYLTAKSRSGHALKRSGRQDGRRRRSPSRWRTSIRSRSPLGRASCASHRTCCRSPLALQ